MVCYEPRGLSHSVSVARGAGDVPTLTGRSTVWCYSVMKKDRCASEVELKTRECAPPRPGGSVA